MCRIEIQSLVFVQERRRDLFLSLSGGLSELDSSSGMSFSLDKVTSSSL